MRRVKGPIQGNACAARIAASGLGESDPADMPELVELEHVVEPQPVNRAVYDERYRTFLEIHRRMRPLHRRINKGAP